MGADIKSLRTRIRSVDSTLHLTKAMGLVASSKIRRANRDMNRTREYASAMQDVVDVLCAAPECERSPFMRPAGEGTRLIVIAGDRGLAGGYNANVFRLAATLPEAEVTAIGKRACDRYGQPFFLGALSGNGGEKAGGPAVPGVPGGKVQPAGHPVYPV